MSAGEHGQAPDWRNAKLDQLRATILSADAGIVETVKWRKPSNPGGVPVWEKDGVICTGERYRDKVKLTFIHGASLPDPAGLFNASLDGGARRAIDIAEGGRLNTKALKALVKAAVAYDTARAAAKKPAGR
jgi:hypothetical protein